MPPKRKNASKPPKRKINAKNTSEKKREHNDDDPVKSKYFKTGGGSGDSVNVNPKTLKKDKSTKQSKGNQIKEDTTKSDCKTPVTPSGRLQYSFFNKCCEKLAKDLLGKKIVRRLPTGEVVSGVIVETEAYLGGEDKAAHSYNGKRTDRNEAMYMPPGTAYVYHIYGTYTCVNISSQGDGAAVLIRGLDPIDGLDTMKKLRGSKRSDKGAGLKHKDIGSGPSKLTQALSIDKAGINKQDITCFSEMWLEDGPDEIDFGSIISSARIGVDYAEEWAKKPLRFYIKGNKSVSVKDKEAEKNHQSEKVNIS